MASHELTKYNGGFGMRNLSPAHYLGEVIPGVSDPDKYTYQISANGSNYDPGNITAGWLESPTGVADQSTGIVFYDDGILFIKFDGILSTWIPNKFEPKISVIDENISGENWVALNGNDVTGVDGNRHRPYATGAGALKNNVTTKVAPGNYTVGAAWGTFGITGQTRRVHLENGAKLITSGSISPYGFPTGPNIFNSGSNLYLTGGGYIQHFAGFAFDSRGANIFVLELQELILSSTAIGIGLYSKFGRVNIQKVTMSYRHCFFSGTSGNDVEGEQWNRVSKFGTVEDNYAGGRAAFNWYFQNSWLDCNEVLEVDSYYRNVTGSSGFLQVTMNPGNLGNTNFLGYHQLTVVCKRLYGNNASVTPYPDYSANSNAVGEFAIGFFGSRALLRLRHTYTTIGSSGRPLVHFSSGIEDCYFTFLNINHIGVGNIPALMWGGVIPDLTNGTKILFENGTIVSEATTQYFALIQCTIDATSSIIFKGMTFDLSESTATSMFHIHSAADVQRIFFIDCVFLGNVGNSMLAFETNSVTPIDIRLTGCTGNIVGMGANCNDLLGGYAQVSIL